MNVGKLNRRTHFKASSDYDFLTEQWITNNNSYNNSQNIPNIESNIESNDKSKLSCFYHVICIPALSLCGFIQSCVNRLKNNDNANNIDHHNHSVELLLLYEYTLKESYNRFFCEIDELKERSIIEIQFNEFWNIGTNEINNLNIDTDCSDVHDNLTIICNIKPGNKLCVDSDNGKLSIDNSYFPAISRMFNRNNKMTSFDKVDETIRMGIHMRNIDPRIDEIFNNGELQNGILNLAKTYENTGFDIKFTHIASLI